uniref:Uncharacterized protein n=1 Tax=Arundo donax TaxID=35708 RepID=A0A0A8Y614_ARUDO
MALMGTRHWWLASPATPSTSPPGRTSTASRARRGRPAGGLARLWRYSAPPRRSTRPAGER